MGHLHLDHAGGLEHFRGTDVPIYTHEKEIKHAFYSVATKTDIGVYLPKDLTFDLNWKPWNGPFLEIAPGINLRHSPGHTPGLCIMQVNLQKSGTFIFTTESVPAVMEGWIHWLTFYVQAVSTMSKRIMIPTYRKGGLRETTMIGLQATR